MTRWRGGSISSTAGPTQFDRFLISIDEFERLEDLFPGDRRDLLRLMGLFRATIQHRHRVRLLVSGVAPFEELGPLWNDHFINVRELRIGHLDRRASVDLLCKPIPEFSRGCGSDFSHRRAHLRAHRRTAVFAPAVRDAAHHPAERRGSTHGRSGGSGPSQRRTRSHKAVITSATSITTHLAMRDPFSNPSLEARSHRSPPRRAAGWNGDG